MLQVGGCRLSLRGEQGAQILVRPVAFDMPSLDQLCPGQRGRISALMGNDGLVQRLMEMGLFEGEEVEVIAQAPLGDPLEIRLGDSRC